jgi:hypothetical protein
MTFLALAVVTGNAGDLVTKDGNTYKKAVVTKITPESVIVLHSKGTAELKPDNLPDGFIDKINESLEEDKEVSESAVEEKEELDSNDLSALGVDIWDEDRIIKHAEDTFYRLGNNSSYALGASLRNKVVAVKGNILYNPSNPYYVRHSKNGRYIFALAQRAICLGKDAFAEIKEGIIVGKAGSVNCDFDTEVQSDGTVKVKNITIQLYLSTPHNASAFASDDSGENGDEDKDILGIKKSYLSRGVPFIEGTKTRKTYYNRDLYKLLNTKTRRTQYDLFKMSVTGIFNAGSSSYSNYSYGDAIKGTLTIKVPPPRSSKFKTAFIYVTVNKKRNAGSFTKKYNHFMKTKRTYKVRTKYGYQTKYRNPKVKFYGICKFNNVYTSGNTISLYLEAINPPETYPKVPSPKLTMMD